MIKIPKEAEKIIEKLNKSGFEAYAVGGCVRDSLLGKEPQDWDICTSARPEQTEKCLKEYKIIETGIKHGTVTVLAEGKPFEVTTYRVDGKYLNNRKPEQVCFVENIREDLGRRDFTINAMAYNREDGIVDMFGGQEDLKHRIIRCAGEAEVRFEEDALRILRALRFASVLGFDIEEKTSDAMRKKKHLLRNISKERIQMELVKLLMGDGAGEILVKYSDVLAAALPQIEPMIGFEQNNIHHSFDVWQHSAEALKYTPKDKVLRLAALLHDSGKPFCYTCDEEGTGHFYGHAGLSEEKAAEIMRELRFDNQTKHEVCQLVKYHDGEIIPERRYVKRWLNKMGKEQFARLLQLKYADMMGQSMYKRTEKQQALNKIHRVMEEVLEEEECFSLRDLAVNGRDLTDMGITGKRVGELLNVMLEDVIEGRLENKKSVLLESIESFK